jgi:site-specific DNA-adenine methylase
MAHKAEVKTTDIPDKTLFKWIGGKKWLGSKLKTNTTDVLNENRDTYIEPFVGGMGAFLAILPILKERGVKKFILNDLNSNVIDIYKTVKDDPKALISVFSKIELDYYKEVDKFKEQGIYELHKTDQKRELKGMLGLKLHEDELFPSQATGVIKAPTGRKMNVSGVYGTVFIGSGGEWKYEVDDEDLLSKLSQKKTAKLEESINVGAEVIQIVINNKAKDEDGNKALNINNKSKLKNTYTGAVKFFNDMKARFNELKLAEKRTDKERVEMASILMFFQIHSFNSVYRENGKGEYNVPYNWDNKKIQLSSKVEQIEEFRKLFNELDIVFENMDVFELLNKYKSKNSFVYLDPPYLNQNENDIGLIKDVIEHEEASKKEGYLGRIEEAKRKMVGKSKSENSYNKDHFGYKEQMKLLDLLDSNFNNFMYSNHNMSSINVYFNKPGWGSEVVNRKNIMTSKVENRGDDKEEILGWRKS